jgi:hypothetical protein
LLKRMPRARVLLYNHGQLRERDKIDRLGQRLLNRLLDERKHERSRRPIFFLCHSTGGLVAKACLALASQAESSQAILTSCHGIAFFATPHQGSTYLSAEEYQRSIRRLLYLEHDIPLLLREQFRPRQERLWHLSNQFKALSADMKVWSFLETIDSTLHVQDLETNNLIEFHAPITSIRSGLLSIEHENEIPMGTDHAGTSCFQGQEQALEAFLTELNDSVNVAVELSKQVDHPLHVENEVMVQINGFFEDTALGVSDETPLKLWSTQVSLEDYLARGPSTCLRERLERIQPGTMDDSSLSSYGSRFPSPKVVQGPDGHEHEDSMDDDLTDDDNDEHYTHDTHEVLHESDDRPSRPTLKHGQSFQSAIDPALHSPTIHISKAATDGYFDRPSSESPPPVERRKKESIAEALGLSHIKSHRRNVSDDSSHGSSSRPGSYASPPIDGIFTNLLTNTCRSSASPSRQAEFLTIPASTRDRINQNADGADIPRSLPRFDRPDAGTEKLLWIHVPYTHTGWVSQVIRRACQDRQEPTLYGIPILSKHNFTTDPFGV